MLFKLSCDKLSCETNIVHLPENHLPEKKTVSVPSHFPSRVEFKPTHSVFTPWISLKAGGILMEPKTWLDENPYLYLSIPRSCTFLPNVACKHFGKVDNDSTWSEKSGSSYD